jgi:two-component system sensor histidine kinase KdpD
LDDIRATLIATVSHDLRSPLAAAITAVESLSHQTAPWSVEDEAALVAAARASLAQISRLIEGLLDAHRIEHRTGAVACSLPASQMWCTPLWRPFLMQIDLPSICLPGSPR